MKEEKKTRTGDGRANPSSSGTVVTLRKDLPKNHLRTAGENIAHFSHQGDTVAVKNDPLAEAMAIRARQRSSAQEVHCEEAPDRCEAIPTVVLVPGRRDRLRRSPIRRSNSPSRVLPCQPREAQFPRPSTATINAEVQEIQLDQDVIDQLEGNRR